MVFRELESFWFNRCICVFSSTIIGSCTINVYDEDLLPANDPIPELCIPYSSFTCFANSSILLVLFKITLFYAC
jgi:hypothetical protein